MSAAVKDGGFSAAVKDGGFSTTRFSNGLIPPLETGGGGVGIGFTVVEINGLNDGGVSGIVVAGIVVVLSIIMIILTPFIYIRF